VDLVENKRGHNYTTWRHSIPWVREEAVPTPKEKIRRGIVMDMNILYDAVNDGNKDLVVRTIHESIEQAANYR
jgi:hypothetical protein